MKPHAVPQRPFSVLETTDMDFDKCDEISVWNVLCGEYDCGEFETAGDFHILDIGANVGAFSIWACRKWPQATVTAYEPDPACCEFFRRNIATANLTDRVTLVEAAVYPTFGPSVPLYRGANQSGENSLYCKPITLQTPIDVPCIHPDELPRAPVIKVDTEGSEIPILHALLQRFAPALAFIEYHNDMDRMLLSTMFHDYRMLMTRSLHIGVGVIAYVHRRNLGIKEVSHDTRPAEDPA